MLKRKERSISSDDENTAIEYAFRFQSLQLESKIIYHPAWIPIEIWKFHILNSLNLSDYKTLREVCRGFLAIATLIWEVKISAIHLIHILDFKKENENWPINIYSLNFDLPVYRNYKRIQWEKCDYDEWEDTWKVIPKNFHNIYSKCGCIKEIDFEAACFKLNSEHLNNLPKSLTKLSVKRSRIINTGLLEKIENINLTHLNISLTEGQYDSAKRFPLTLVYLDISFTNITSSFIRTLSSLQSLENLNMFGFSTYDITDEDIKFLPSTLKSLDLTSNHEFSIEGLKDLPKKLEQLQLKSSRLLGAETIQYLPRTLRKLELSGYNMTEEVIRYLPTGLHTLKFTCVSVNNTNIPDLPTTLTSLNIKYWCWYNLDVRLSPPPSLKKLSLTGVHSITHTFLYNLPKHITELNLSETEIRDVDFAAIHKGIVKLKIKRCNRLTGKCLFYISPSTEYLDISDCYYIDDTHIARLSNLKHLYICGCTEIKIESLFNVNWKRLECLGISFNQFDSNSKDSKLYKWAVEKDIFLDIRYHP